jgi:hypothetical protein
MTRIPTGPKFRWERVAEAIALVGRTPVAIVDRGEVFGPPCPEPSSITAATA